jgi:hypothetical protein
MTEPAGSGETNNGTSNPLKDVQNILGFLVAGFAGVLSFLGIRSGEVSSILRGEDTEGSASFIMLLLFLAAFAAVSGVALSHAKKMSPWWVLPIVLGLVGTGLILIWATPVTGAFQALRKIGAVGGCVLMVLAVFSAWAIIIFRIRRKTRGRNEDASARLRAASARLHAAGIIAEIKNEDSSASLQGGGIPAEIVCILVSLALLGFGIYGAIRVEAYSQRLASVQLSASIAKKASGANLSVHVTGSKLVKERYVGVSIRGLPRKMHFMRMCKKSYSNYPNSYEDCLDNPCQYLYSACRLVYGAAVPANANGELNYTLNDGIISGDYLVISVRASLCKQRVGCTGGTKPISQLDINVAKPSARLPSPSPPPKVR